MVAPPTPSLSSSAHLTSLHPSSSLCLLFTTPLLIDSGYSQWKDGSRSFLMQKLLWMECGPLWCLSISVLENSTAPRLNQERALLHSSTWAQSPQAVRRLFDELCCCVGPFKDNTQVFGHISNNYICIGNNPVWLLSVKVCFQIWRPSAEFQNDTFQLDWHVMHTLFCRCCLLDTLS